MKTIKIWYILFMLLPLGAMAQTTIKGIVNDASSKEALPFTAVAIKGTSIGTTTDIDGRFVLRVPAEHASGNLQVSCVGYKTDLRPLSSIESGVYVSIMLQTSVSEINEVAVSAKSKFSQTIVRNAISKTANNYIMRPYNYELSYTDEFVHGKTSRKHSAKLLYYDKTGYKKANPYQNFKNCNYKYLSSTHNYLAQTIGERINNIDDLLKFDIVRQSSFVFDEKRLNDFEIKIEKSLVFNGDSIWVLRYVNNRPNLVTTNDWQATECTGSLMIKKDDFAVLQHSVEIKTAIRNELSQSLAIDTAGKSTQIREVSYRVETNYEKQNGVYVLKRINYSCSADKRNSTLTLEAVKTSGLTPVEGREYLEQAAK